MSIAPSTDLLPAIADEINALHAEVTAALTATLGKAMLIGGKLIEIKASLPHGQFGAWIVNNCQFTDRTARYYMRLAENRELVNANRKSISGLTMSGAIRLLAEPKPSAAPVTPVPRDEQSQAVEAAPQTTARRRGKLAPIEGWSATIEHIVLAATAITQTDDLGLEKSAVTAEQAKAWDRELAEAVAQINRFRRWIRGAR